MKRAGALALASGLLLALGVSGGADGARQPKLQTKVISGPDVEVPPYSLTEYGGYDLTCPPGYRVTGHGVSNGANDVVYADPDFTGRGYAFAFANFGDDYYSASGSIICARGSSGLKVTAAAAADERTRREARRAALDALAAARP